MAYSIRTPSPPSITITKKTPPPPRRKEDGRPMKDTFQRITEDKAFYHNATNWGLRVGRLLLQSLATTNRNTPMELGWEVTMQSLATTNRDTPMELVVHSVNVTYRRSRDRGSSEIAEILPYSKCCTKTVDSVHFILSVHLQRHGLFPGGISWKIRSRFWTAPNHNFGVGWIISPPEYDVLV